MTTAPPRELSGEKARRIVAAMRESVAERGIAGATFEHVAAKAGVSRGLLHYYFRTKERLLVEVVRHDAEVRIGMLDEPLAAATSVDDVIDVLVATVEDLIAHDPGFYALLFELFTAGQANPEIRRELGELYARSRRHVAEILERKQREGVLRLRFDADATVSYLFASADGSALQRLTEPDRDFSSGMRAGMEVARFLLWAD